MSWYTCSIEVSQYASYYQTGDPLWMSSVETHLFPGAYASDAGHLTLGRKALIIRYMLRTLRFIEKSQSVSSQSRMVPWWTKLEEWLSNGENDHPKILLLNFLILFISILGDALIFACWLWDFYLYIFCSVCCCLYLVFNSPMVL